MVLFLEVQITKKKTLIIKKNTYEKSFLNGLVNKLHFVIISWSSYNKSAQTDVKKKSCELDF